MRKSDDTGEWGFSHGYFEKMHYHAKNQNYVHVQIDRRPCAFCNFYCILCICRIFNLKKKNQQQHDGVKRHSIMSL